VFVRRADVRIVGRDLGGLLDSKHEPLCQLRAYGRVVADLIEQFEARRS
jgi:hypothetical protein